MTVFSKFHSLIQLMLLVYYNHGLRLLIELCNHSRWTTCVKPAKIVDCLCSLRLHLMKQRDGTRTPLCTQFTLGETVPVLIHTLLDRIEKYHGQMLVSQALAFMTATKSGIR